MRIILTQMEIEEAIEKLILDQVDVPDDMRIDIDLKATRGEEGYQAFIDIVDHDAPEDGSDRSVDPRIKPIDGAETLGIAEKVLEAKAEASKPRRRGRPAGARNKPKLSEDHRSTEDKVQVTEEPQAEAQAEQAQETVQEAQESVSEAEVDRETREAEQAPTEAPATAEEVVEQPNSEQPVDEPANEPVVAEAQAEEETEVEVAPPVAAPTVTEQDVSTQASDELAESVSESAPEPAPVNPQPTRSLFANLSRPTNGPGNGG